MKALSLDCPNKSGNDMGESGNDIGASGGKWYCWCLRSVCTRRILYRLCDSYHQLVIT
jgi:hypothetical protein